MFRSATSPFQDTRLSKNPKCTEWTQTDIEHLTLKATCIHSILTPGAKIFIHIALRLFSIRKVAKKIGNALNDLSESKVPCIHITSVSANEAKFKGSLEKSKAIWGRSSVLPLFLLQGHMLAKRKQSWKIVSSKFQQCKTVLCQNHWEGSWGEAWKY